MSVWTSASDVHSRRLRRGCHHNHSARFYKALDANMPRWRAIKERLDSLAERILPSLPRQHEVVPRHRERK